MVLQEDAINQIGGEAQSKKRTGSGNNGRKGKAVEKYNEKTRQAGEVIKTSRINDMVIKPDK